MKNEIPASTTSAPIAIARAVELLMPFDDELVETAAVDVVWVGMVACCWGIPGAKGFWDGGVTVPP